MSRYVRSYEDLNVWRDSIVLVKSIYQITATFPDEERYGLISQMRRASVSVPSNIAEGHQRASTREFLHSLSIARGSLGELDTQLVISRELDFSSDVRELREQVRDAGIRLWRLRESLKRRL